ncbi:Adenosylmethionine-8-amino-7-oxononanoate aminotransferase [Candidatus Providencia siddallii]|uniref:Adenosylmethionine-8-amino-7-oxononanoate aminotransferase n=1 Tax=Candidatus Providencia siddallii TaxID=1715285 RepID=A0A0M6W7W1_9GAMM|nr:Adenosylmethionine-8-amino-7-oxononanoate aminotransferase [Candidatus Providencia siddallii]
MYNKLNNIDINFDAKHIWHPYTSMNKPTPVYPIIKAQGVELVMANGKKIIDGMSSWWSAIHGYNHPILNKAAIKQIKKMSHIMFGGITHKPAINLCKQLITITPDPLECVFLADSGSVAIEIALKMALQYWQAKKEIRYHFLTLKYGYHGDTFGAMSVSDPDNSMHNLYKNYLPKHIFIDPPKSGFYDKWDFNDLDILKKELEINNNKIAAIILEPIVQGVGGMHFYHYEYLKGVRQLCNQYNILLIIDEIATGFGRTGKLFACNYADISPDIMCLGKSISGGYVTLSATITTRSIAETISNGDAGCFMHGPTFMGNPLACAIANANISLLLKNPWQKTIKNIEKQLTIELSPLSSYNNVKNVRVLGAIGVVEMKKPVDSIFLQKIFITHGVWIRPFGNLIYITPPYIITKDQLTKITKAITNVLKY